MKWTLAPPGGHGGAGDPAGWWPERWPVREFDRPATPAGENTRLDIFEVFDRLTVTTDKVMIFAKESKV